MHQPGHSEEAPERSRTSLLLHIRQPCKPLKHPDFLYLPLRAQTKQKQVYLKLNSERCMATSSTKEKDVESLRVFEGTFRAWCLDGGQHTRSSVQTLHLETQSLSQNAGQTTVSPGTSRAPCRSPLAGIVKPDTAGQKDLQDSEVKG